MREIRWTDYAEHGLDELFRYGYATFGTALTEAYFDGLMNLIDSIALSEILAYGRPCSLKIDHERAAEFLYHPYRKHVIIFTSHTDTVVIIAIFRAEMSWDRIFDCIVDA